MLVICHEYVAILEFVWLHLQRYIMFGAISSVLALAILAPIKYVTHMLTQIRSQFQCEVLQG